MGGTSKLVTIWPGKDPFSGISVDEIDTTIKKESTWRHIAIVADLAEEAEHVGSWSESCPCHSVFTEENQQYHARSNAGKRKRRKLHQPHGFLPAVDGSGSCPFQGCRAYELAAGKALESLRDKMMANRLKVLAHVSAAPEEERHALISDWEKTRSRLWGDFALVWQVLLFSQCHTQSHMQQCILTCSMRVTHSALNHETSFSCQVVCGLVTRSRLRRL